MKHLFVEPCVQYWISVLQMWGGEDRAFLPHVFSKLGKILLLCAEPSARTSPQRDWWFLCKDYFLTAGSKQISDLPDQHGDDSVLHFRNRQRDKWFRGSWRRSCWHKWAFSMCYNLHWLLGLDLGLVVRWGRGISTLPYVFVLMVCFIDYFSIPQLHLAGFLSSIW